MNATTFCCTAREPMKHEMITVKTAGLTLKVPAHVVASTVIAAALAQIGAAHVIPDPAAPAAPAANGLAIPALGEYWPGQGGHNGGLVPERNGVPAHYLIVAAKDAGDYALGRCGEESNATSKWDGQANTKAMLAAGGHPAAEAASEYTADGHADFFLPAAAELYQCWVYTPSLFAQDCWYWSSSQRSADSAFLMHFDAGYQYTSGKSSELRVRPVRRAFI